MNRWIQFFWKDMNMSNALHQPARGSLSLLVPRGVLEGHAFLQLLHHPLFNLPFRILTGTSISSHKSAVDNTAAKASCGEGMDPLREREAKESIDVKRFERLSDNIIPHILNLYASKATSADFEIYAPDASFEDPLMSARGVKEIKTAFYSLPKVFSESKMFEYNIQENVINQRTGEILIENKQCYKIFGKDLIVTSLISLYIEEGKVIRHEDWWNKKPLWNQNTVRLPFLGRLAEMMRRGSLLMTHAMMGFGKDPHP